MAVFKSRIEDNEVPEHEFLLGDFREVGKTEARQSFLQLIDDLDETSVIVTDRGKKMAVIISCKQFEILLSILRKLSPKASRNPLSGLIAKIGDLEKSSREINELFEQSLKKTSETI